MGIIAIDALLGIYILWTHPPKTSHPGIDWDWTGKVQVYFKYIYWFDFVLCLFCVFVCSGLFRLVVLLFRFIWSCLHMRVRENGFTG